MRKYIISIQIIIALLLSISASFASSGSEKILCTVLSVDSSGDSYFTEKFVELNNWTSDLAAVSLPEGSEVVRFFKAKPDWKMLELHHAPKRQYLLVLQGVLEFRTSKNIIKQFKSGSIVLVEDTYGKGHGTRSAGKEDLVLVWVSLAKDD